MKKSILIALTAAIIGLPCFGEGASDRKETQQQKNTVEALFNNFSKEKNTTHIKINGLVMAFVRAFTDTKGVTGVEVFSFKECDDQMKDKLNVAIKNLKDNTYETLISTNQDGENTKVLLKIKDDFINEIVVITGGNDPAFVRIKGKIKPDDIQSVMNDNKK